MNERWVDFSLAPLRTLLTPAECALCRSSPAPNLPLCQLCLDNLPWNRCACPHCAQPVAVAGLACPRCQKQPLFENAWSAWTLKEPVQSAIWRLKYQSGFGEARWLARAMTQRAPPIEADVLLPVPLHPSRLRERGYNQSMELARGLSSCLNLPCHPRLARRIRATEDQIGRSAAARRRNVKGAFVVSPRIVDQRVLLLDDVMTTGATLAELAETCVKAGAQSVTVWTAARTP